jgi:DNA-binding NarL/FixJ family response regulator
MPQKAKILLVDDHPLVREWLATLINQQWDLQVCGDADNAKQAMELMATVHPDAAVVDMSLEGCSGIELIKNIKASHPNVAVIVLSMHDESLYAARAFHAGAQGYIMKREATKKVLHGIRCVLDGKRYFSDEISMLIAGKSLMAQPGTAGSFIDSLSDRELEVFQLLGRGYRTRQIADEMQVSFKTVQTFCARIKEKLQVSSATELLREAIRWHDSQ